MADQNAPRDPATPEEIWNILRKAAEIRNETDQMLQRLGQETDRRTQENDRRMRRPTAGLQETDRQMQETDRQMQETDLRLRKRDELFNGQWGKLMESLVEGDLVKLLQQRGIAVGHTMTNAKKDYGQRRWEFDILAVNGEEVVVVEVKTTLKVDDVDYFVERLQDFPELMPEFADRLIYGALAYLKTDGSVTVHAGRQGLYVIRATGSSASITNAEGFAPRAFGPRSPARQAQ